MKNRLQELWKYAVPEVGPCPQPDVKAVQRRVDAALEVNRRTFHLRRKLKLAALCAAALVLLTGAAAVVEVVWPEYNVLSAFFQGDAEQWKNMVNTQPVSVSDDNYTLTLTSSLADRSFLFYTVTLEAKNDEAWQAVEERLSDSWDDLFSFRATAGLGLGGEADPENRTMYLNVSAGRTWGNHSSIRLELMKKGVWLNFSYTPVSDLSLDINADGPAKADHVPDPFDGTVTLKRLTLSPFTVQAKYITEDTRLFPVLQFLWADGTYSQVELGGQGTGHGSGTEDGKWDHTMSESYSSPQDLSTLEAVIFGGMAYPLDHGEPYEMDLDALTLREPAQVP